MRLPEATCWLVCSSEACCWFSMETLASKTLPELTRIMTQLPPYFQNRIEHRVGNLHRLAGRLIGALVAHQVRRLFVQIYPGKRLLRRHRLLRHTGLSGTGHLQFAG